MAESLIVVTGDKGGVGKSTITALLVEWLTHQKQSVSVIDADPNQTIKTWVDKCAEKGREVSTSQSKYTIVDTAGTSGSFLTRYIHNAEIILVPFKPHVADLEVVVGWFLSLKESLQSRVLFVPNMLSNTKEQRTGLQEIESVLKEEERGTMLTGLSERKAVYPSLLNGSQQNFFETKLDENTRKETKQLFTSLTELLKR